MNMLRKPKSFPLRIEQCGEDGWFFVSCDEIPGLSVFGPDLDDLFDQIAIAGTELLRKRGEHVTKMAVVSVSTKPEPAEKSTARTLGSRRAARSGGAWLRKLESGPQKMNSRRGASLHER